MREKLSTTWKRRVAQLGFLVLLGEFSFYGLFRCPFAVPYVSCGNCPVLQCPGRDLWAPVWIGLGITGILFGRAFCGWACPGGLVSELFSKLSLLRTKTERAFDTWGKYAILIACLAIVFFISNQRWAIPIRTGDFLNSVSLTFEHADQLWLWRTGFIAGSIAFAIFVPLFWCRYLCPTGGILEILNRISLFKYYKAAQCNDCDACRGACTALTRPAELNCTNCGDCRDVCPVEAVKMGREPKPEAGSKQEAA